MSQMNLDIGFVGMTADEYHSNLATGRSDLSAILKSPGHWRYNKENRRETKSFNFGHALHAAQLEPHVYSSEYVMVDESLLEGTLKTLGDMREAAAVLGVRSGPMNKDEMKAAIKAADVESAFRFKTDVDAELAVIMQQRLVGALQSVDEYKAAATSLGIEVGKMKKDELKAAIKAADSTGRFVFRDDVVAEVDLLGQEMLKGALVSTDDFKAAAMQLEINIDAPDELSLRAAIKAADKLGQFRFRDEEFDRLYGGKTILSQDDVDAITSILQNIEGNQGCRVVFRRGFAEMSVFWIDPETGIQCKCRPDWLIVDEHGRVVGIADLKTTDDASLEGFARSIAKYGYDLQAAFYIDGVKTVVGKELPFFFVACEKKAPHAVAVYRADEKMVNTGRNSNRGYKAALAILAWCRANDQWPTYQGFSDVTSLDEIETIGLPRYAANSEMFADDEAA